MNVNFTPRAWYEYTGWQLEDKKILKRAYYGDPMLPLFLDNFDPIWCIDFHANFAIWKFPYRDLDGIAVRKCHCALRPFEVSEKRPDFDAAASNVKRTYSEDMVYAPRRRAARPAMAKRMAKAWIAELAIVAVDILPACDR